MIETRIIAFQGKNTRTREEWAVRSGVSEAVIAANHRATRGPSSGKTRSATFATSVKTTDRTSETINHCTSYQSRAPTCDAADVAEPSAADRAHAVDRPWLAVPLENAVPPSPSWPRSRRYSDRTMSTEISTAGTVPRFSSQCLVFRSSGQPTPGP